MRTAISLVLIALAAAQSRAPVYDPQLLAWSEALKQWRREGDSAALQLARGVLFDCAAHRRSVDILFPPGRDELGGSSSCRYITQTRCLDDAERAFAQAVKMDPALTEGRLRLAASRSERSGEGDGDLVAVFGVADVPPAFRYLAAIFLGKSAYARRETTAASEWFARAAAIDRGWTVAPLLRWAAGDGLLPAAGSGPDSTLDPWYSYRCGILTDTVRTTVSGWMTRVGER